MEISVWGLEWLGEKTFASGSFGALLVERLKSAGQQQDGNVFQLVGRLDELANFIAIFLRHDDVAEHDVRLDGANLVDGLLPVPHGVELEILIGERELDNLLNGNAVVGEQDLVSHRPSFRLFEFDRPSFGVRIAYSRA